LLKEDKMPYKLKKNAPEFDCVDGPFAGKKYRHGKTYPDVPPGDKGRFIEVEVASKARKPVTKSGKPAIMGDPPLGWSGKRDESSPKKNDASEDDQKASVKAPTKGGSK